MTEFSSFKEYMMNKYLTEENKTNAVSEDVVKYINEHKDKPSPDLSLDPDDDKTIIKFKAIYIMLSNTANNLSKLAQGGADNTASKLECYDVFKNHKTVKETTAEIENLSQSVKNNKDAINAADTISGKVNKKNIKNIEAAKETLQKHSGDIVQQEESINNDDVLLEISRMVGGIRRTFLGLQSTDRLAKQNDYLSKNNILHTIEKQSNKHNSYKNIDKIFSTAEHGLDDSKISKDGSTRNDKGQSGNRVLSELEATTNRKIDLIAGRLNVETDIKQANNLLTKLSNPNLKQYYKYIRKNLIDVQSILTNVWAKIKTAAYNISTVLDGYSASVSKVSDAVNQKFSDMQAYSNKEHTKLNSQIYKVEDKLAKKSKDITDEDLVKASKQASNAAIRNYAETLLRFNSTSEILKALGTIYNTKENTGNIDIDNAFKAKKIPHIVDQSKALCLQYLLLLMKNENIKFEDKITDIVSSLDNIGYQNGVQAVLDTFKDFVVKSAKKDKDQERIAKDLDFIKGDKTTVVPGVSGQNLGTAGDVSKIKGSTDKEKSDENNDSNIPTGYAAAYQKYINPIAENKNITLEDIHKVFYYLLNKPKDKDNIPEKFDIIIKDNKMGNMTDIDKLKILFAAYLKKDNAEQGSLFGNNNYEKVLQNIFNIDKNSKDNGKSQLKKEIEKCGDVKSILDNPAAAKLFHSPARAAQDFVSQPKSIFDLALQKAKENR